MDPEISKKLEELEKKIDAAYKSSEKMRKYFLWGFWITVIVIVFPLIGLIFVIPQFISAYSNIGNLGL